MNEYIDKENTLSYIENYIQEINTGYGDLNSHTNRILRTIIEGIEKMPSIKERNGEWKEVDGRLECSLCGKTSETLETATHIIYLSTNFCQHCGANMKGGK